MPIPAPVVNQFIQTSAALLQIKQSQSANLPGYLSRRVATEEILCAASITFSEDSLIFYRNYEIFPDLDLIATLYLKTFSMCSIISIGEYENNPSFSSALTIVDPDFEFPTWDGRLVSEFLSTKANWQTSLPWTQSIRVLFKEMPGSFSEELKSISMADFFQLKPFSDNGWEFPSGEKIYLQFLR